MIIKENIQLGEGGEILSADITQVKKVTAEEFCQVYLKDNDEFYSLSKAEANILSVCMYLSAYYDDKDLNFPGNKITFDSQLKDVIKNKTKLADSTVKNTMSSLVKKEMLIKDANYKGVYYLNPKYFFKGRITQRTQLIRKITEYQIES